MNAAKCLPKDQQVHEPLESNSIETKQFSPVNQSYAKFDDDKKRQTALNLDDSFQYIDPFRLNGPPHQSATKMERFCPRPMRQYPTHKVILQPELFEDWHVDTSVPVFID